MHKSYEERDDAWDIWQDKVLAFTPEFSFETYACLHENVGFEEFIANLLAYLLCNPQWDMDTLSKIVEAARPGVEKALRAAVDQARPSKLGGRPLVEE